MKLPVKTPAKILDEYGNYVARCEGGRKKEIFGKEVDRITAIAQLEEYYKPLEPIDENKIIDILEGYELNIERSKTNSERRRYRLELTQRIRRCPMNEELEWLKSLKLRTDISLGEDGYKYLDNIIAKFGLSKKEE